MLGQLQRRNRTYRRGSAIVAGDDRAVAAILMTVGLVRVGYGLLMTPVTVPFDSNTYRFPVDGVWTFSYVSFIGHAWRGWGVTLPYALLLTDRARVMFQAAAGAFAAVLLLYAVLSHVVHRRLRLIVGLIVGLVLVTPPVASVDGTIRSESLAISTLLALLGFLLLVVKSPHRTGFVVGAGVAYVWFLSTRPNGWILASTMLASVGFILWRARRQRLSACVVLVTVLCLGWFFVSNSNRDHAWAVLGQHSRTAEVAVYVESPEVNPDYQQVASYLYAHGMPNCGTPHGDPGMWMNIEYQSCHGLARWIDRNFLRTYAVFLLTHPDYVAQQEGRVLPTALGGESIGSEPSVVPTAVSDAVFRSTSPSADKWLGGDPLVLWATAGLLLYGWRRRRRGDRVRTLRAVELVTWVVAVAAVVDGAFALLLMMGSPARNGWIEADVLRLAVVAAVAFAADDAFSRRRMPAAPESLPAPREAGQVLSPSPSGA